MGRGFRSPLVSLSVRGCPAIGLIWWDKLSAATSLSILLMPMWDKIEKVFLEILVLFWCQCRKRDFWTAICGECRTGSAFGWLQYLAVQTHAILIVPGKNVFEHSKIYILVYSNKILAEYYLQIDTIIWCRSSMSLIFPAKPALP